MPMSVWLIVLALVTVAAGTPSCENKQTLREYSKQIVLPLFSKLVDDCVAKTPANCTPGAAFPSQCDKKADVLALRDALNAWNFAWFPLGARAFSEVAWEEFDPPHSSKHDWTPSFKTQVSHDPLAPLLYYVSELYTTLGSIEDAQSAHNTKLEQELSLAANLYLGAMQALLGARTGGQITGVVVDHTASSGSESRCVLSAGNNSGLEWSTYWAGSGYELDEYWYDGNAEHALNLSTSIYAPGIYRVSHSNASKLHEVTRSQDRFGQEKGQFWSGESAAPPDFENPLISAEPHPTLAVEALTSLLQSSMNGSLVRWHTLSGSSWWPSGLFGEQVNEHIDAYHELRKAVRALARIVDQYDFVFGSFLLPVPATVLAELGLDPQSSYQYGQLFCQSSFTNCTSNASAVQKLGLLLLSQFEAPAAGRGSSWWGLEYNDWASMRALTVLETLRIGHSTTRALAPFCPSPDCTLCPANQYPHAWAQCSTATNSTGGVVVQGCTGMNASFVPPSFDALNSSFAGTFCSVDDWMGDVHDKMVLYQKLKSPGSTPGTPQLEAIVSAEVVALAEYFTQGDLGQQIQNVLLGVCSFKS